MWLKLMVSTSGKTQKRHKVKFSNCVKGKYFIYILTYFQSYFLHRKTFSLCYILKANSQREQQTPKCLVKIEDAAWFMHVWLCTEVGVCLWSIFFQNVNLFFHGIKYQKKKEKRKSNMLWKNSCMKPEMLFHEMQNKLSI